MAYFIPNKSVSGKKGDNSKIFTHLSPDSNEPPHRPYSCITSKKRARPKTSSFAPCDISEPLKKRRKIKESPDAVPDTIVVPDNAFFLGKKFIESCKIGAISYNATTPEAGFCRLYSGFNNICDSMVSIYFENSGILSYLKTTHSLSKSESEHLKCIFQKYIHESKYILSYISSFYTVPNTYLIQTKKDLNIISGTITALKTRNLSNRKIGTCISLLNLPPADSLKFEESLITYMYGFNSNYRINKIFNYLCKKGTLEFNQLKGSISDKLSHIKKGNQNIKQECFGNCVLLAILKSLSYTGSKRIASLFTHVEKETSTIKLYRSNEHKEIVPVFITVNNSVQSIKTVHNIFTSFSGSGGWILILEKALAAFLEFYINPYRLSILPNPLYPYEMSIPLESINNLHILKTLTAFTGLNSEFISICEKSSAGRKKFTGEYSDSDNEIFEIIKQNLDSKDPVVAGSISQFYKKSTCCSEKTETKCKNGLCASHAYSLIDTMELADETTNKKYKYVVIDNPHNKDYNRVYFFDARTNKVKSYEGKMTDHIIGTSFSGPNLTYAVPEEERIHSLDCSPNSSISSDLDEPEFIAETTSLNCPTSLFGLDLNRCNPNICISTLELNDFLNYFYKIVINKS